LLHQLFHLNPWNQVRNLIEGTLDGMYRKYFAAYRVLPNNLSRFVFPANVGSEPAGDFICFCFEEAHGMHPTLTVGWAFVFSGIV
jgi:hypothetical protein